MSFALEGSQRGNRHPPMTPYLTSECKPGSWPGYVEDVLCSDAISSSMGVTVQDEPSRVVRP